MKEQKRVWISAIVAGIIVALVVYLSPSAVYRPHGVLLPAKKIQKPISPTIVVQGMSRPANGKLLGYIHIERYYNGNRTAAEKEIWHYAQQLAAKVGANTVVIQLFQMGQVTHSNYIYVFQGTAYYSPTLRHPGEKF